MKFKRQVSAAILLVAASILVFNSNKKRKTDDSSEKPLAANHEGGGDTHQHTRAARSRPRNSGEMPTINWAKEIDDVLAAESISPGQARQTLLAITTDKDVPLSIRNDALEHALNFVDEEDYEIVQRILGLGENELPEMLVQTILDDSLNREPRNQVATALKVIQGTHAKVISEARELLEFHLEVDHGDNLQQWEDAAQTFLATQSKADEK